MRLHHVRERSVLRARDSTSDVRADTGTTAPYVTTAVCARPVRAIATFSFLSYPRGLSTLLCHPYQPSTLLVRSRSPLPPPSSPGWQTPRSTQQATRSDCEGTHARRAGASRRWPHFPTTSRDRHAASAPIRAYGSRVTWRCMWRPTERGPSADWTCCRVPCGGGRRVGRGSTYKIYMGMRRLDVRGYRGRPGTPRRRGHGDTV